MKVIDRINEILKEKNISKKELARRLIDLDMKAAKTGEVPSVSSIYAYLNGNIELKADFIPFIAKALGRGGGGSSKSCLAPARKTRKRLSKSSTKGSSTYTDTIISLKIWSI